MKGFYLGIVESCNLKCVFCSRGDRQGIYDFETIKKKIRGYEGKNFKVFITGGEPFLHGELEKIIAYLKKGGFKEVVIQTNGTLVTLERAKALKQAGLDQIIFSIHSHISENEDELMQGKDVLAKQLKGLENAHRAGLITYVTVVVTKGNYKDLLGFFGTLLEKYPYLNHFVFNFVDVVGRADMNKDVVPKLSDIEPFLSETLMRLYKAGKSFRVERIPLCYMPEFAENNTELRRLITGEVNATFRDEKAISYTNDYFSENYVRGKACEPCWLNKICPGIMKNYANLYGTDELYPLFIDPKKIVRLAGPD